MIRVTFFGAIQARREENPHTLWDREGMGRTQEGKRV